MSDLVDFIKPDLPVIDPDGLRRGMVVEMRERATVESVDEDCMVSTSGLAYHLADYEFRLVSDGDDELVEAVIEALSLSHEVSEQSIRDVIAIVRDAS